MLRRLIHGGFLWRLVLVPLLLLLAALAILLHELVRDPRLPLDWRRGMNVTAYQPEAFGSGTADDALRALRRTGTTSVEIVPNWYMDAPSSSTVAPDPAKTPTDASVEHAIATARELGFDVWLKPHVDVKDGSFRGEIQPDDREAWFSSYRAMIESYADLAARSGATGFVVGTELSTMTAETDRFRELIAAARDRFEGTLTYAANRIEEAEKVGFWDDLDLIGIDAYMPLETPNPDDPSVDELVEAWQPHIERIEALHEKTGKEVLFTELGYESQVGAALEDATGEVSQTAQAKAYDAAFEAWSDADFEWFQGIYWWDWSAEGLNADTEDGSFRMAGKQAEDVLRHWYEDGYELPPDVDRGEPATLGDFGD